MATEGWETEREIISAGARFAERIPGYESPAAYGVGAVMRDNTVSFPHVNVGDHHLPAVVLANVCGHRAGTHTYRLSGDQLDAAIELLAPAEACTLYDHPNLWSWRSMRSGAAEHAGYVAVFLADVDGPGVDELGAAFRDALASARRRAQ